VSRRLTSGWPMTAIGAQGRCGRRFCGRRSPNRDDDSAPRGPRWACDQRNLRSGADPAKLSQREAGSRPAEVERNSPLLHLPGAAGELVVAYGTRELPELRRQSIDYGQAWTELGLHSHLLPVDGTDHFTILEALANPRGALTRALLDMIGG
jgi:hypothetical protein